MDAPGHGRLAGKQHGSSTREVFIFGNIIKGPVVIKACRHGKSSWDREKNHRFYSKADIKAIL